MNDKAPLRPTLRPILLLHLLLALGALYVGFAVAQSPDAQAAMRQVGILAAPVEQESGGEIGITSSTGYPDRFTYQGLLYEPDGDRLNGTFKMSVYLYDHIAEGAPIWADTFNEVKIRDGVFTLVLGSQVELGTVFQAAPRYVGIRINDGDEIVPRERIHPVPWAVNAEVAQDANNASVADIATEAIGATTADKALVTTYLKPLAFTKYVNPNQDFDTAASVSLALWNTYPDGVMCGLNDIFTPLGSGMLQLDCRIDPTTKSVIAGPHSYCAAICVRLK